MNWIYDPSQYGQPVYDKATGRRICNMDCVDLDTEELDRQRDAEGRLVAAAPDMLTALEDALWMCENILIHKPSASLTRLSVREHIEPFRAAINKAKGEPL